MGAKGLLRRPFVGLALVFGTGICLGLTFSNTHTHLLLSLSFSSLLIAIISCFLHWNKFATVCIFSAVLLCAWTSVSIRSSSPDISEAFGAAFAEDNSLRTRIIGTIGSDPMECDLRDGGKALSFVLHVESIQQEYTLAINVSDRLKIRLYGKIKWSPVYGEKWCFDGSLNSISFSDSGWSGRRHYYRFNTGISKAKRISASGYGASIITFCGRMRRAASELLIRGIENGNREAVGLMQALVLGYRSQLSGEVRDYFARTGTLHIFAISGLHVGIVAVMCIFLLGAMRVPLSYRVLFLGPVVVGYTLITGGRASAIRASIMAILYCSAPLFKRKPDVVSALAASGVIIAAIWPEQLFNIGFIYSFTVVVGIIMYYPLLNRYLWKTWQPDPFRIEKERLWIKTLRWLLWYMRGIFCVSVAAWLASAPLSAHFFGQFAPVALVANLIVIPVAFFVLISGALAVITGSCLGIFAEIFNNAGYALVRFLIMVMSRASKLPGACIKLQEPLAVKWVLLWYIVLVAFAMYLHDQNEYQE